LFQEFLDFFEKELESERFGSWLGGTSFSTADIALGKFLSVRNGFLKL